MIFCLLLPSLLSLALVALFAPFPLFATPSPESANLLGLSLGPVGAWCAAMWAHHREKGLTLGHAHTRACLEMALSLLLAFSIFVGCSYLRALGMQNCSPSQDIATYFAMSFPVVFLNMAIGLLVGRIARSKKQASLLLLLFFSAMLGLEGIWWWENPGLRSANHFFFVIAGDLIEGDAINTDLLCYRLSTLFWALGTFSLSFAIAGKTKLYTERRRENVSAFVLRLLSFGLLAGAFIISQNALQKLIVPRTQLLKDYSLLKEMGPVVVHAHPAYTSPEDVDAVLAETKLWLSRLQKRTGLAPEGSIRIFLHKDTDTIAYYTGARHVHFALPRHREFHISTASFPHPSLGHELAHVLIGQVTRTVWGTPGRFWILPNFALTEGLAVAVSSELNISAELTLQEQAAAIYQASLAPSLLPLFKATPVGFFLQQPALAYVLTGAFLEWYLPQENGALVRLSLAGELTPAVNGTESARALIERFKKDMLAMTLPTFAVPWAKERFQAKSIALAQCPRSAVAREMEIEALALQQNFKGLKALVDASEAAGSSAIYASFGKKAFENRRYTLATKAYVAALSDTNEGNAEHLELARNLGDAYFLDGDLRQALSQWGSIELAFLPRALQRPIIARLKLASAALVPDTDRTPLFSALHLLTEPQISIDAQYAELATLTERYAQKMPQDTQALLQYLLVKSFAVRQTMVSNDTLEELLQSLQGAQNHLPRLFLLELLWVCVKYHADLQRWPQVKEHLHALKNLADLAGIKQRIKDWEERVAFWMPQ